MTGAQELRGGQPPLPRRAENPEWKRGTCPLCGSDVVSNAYHIGGKGYRIFHECVAGLGEPEARCCDYRVEFTPNGTPKVLGRAAEVKR